MMPVPATLTSYLPVLLVSVTNHNVPDDSSYSTQPSGQVDYLSHEWREEDVWRSWRNMTRQKNAIANGMRLENASWRTWWKQRNKLSTVSPETLNWLKDSDVTWLYGPLHIGSDWSKTAHHEPPPSPEVQFRQGSVDSSSGSRAPTPSGKKPILKRRSISQLLSLPASPFFTGEGSDDEDADSTHHGDDLEANRPPLMHTKSDTHISWRLRTFRKESPPRIIASALPAHDEHLATPSGTTTSSDTSTGSSQDLSTASIAGTDGTAQGKKKHISFNTFVEQYIAIEKPKPTRNSGAVYYSDPAYIDGYDEDSSEAGDDEDADRPSSFYLNDRPGVQSDSDDEDEDEVLEMRSKRSRSNSSSSSSRAPAMRANSPPSVQVARRPALLRQASADREHMTIAPIAPTILKSTGVGNHLLSISEDRLLPSHKEVELVYVPPSNSIYSLPGTPNPGAEDVYHHRESYFSVGTTSTPSIVNHNRSRSADSSPTVSSFSAGFPAVPTQLREPVRTTSHTGNLQEFFQQPIFETPIRNDDDGEDAYDYFGGPDLGEDYNHYRRHGHVRTRRSIADHTDSPEGHAWIPPRERSFRSGRSSAGHTPMSASPRIVVNEVAGATDEREEMSTGSSEEQVEVAKDTIVPRKADGRIDDIPLAVSYIHHGPGPPSPISVPRIATHAPIGPGSPTDATYLSPTDSLPGRGRSPGCSPVSGSTTTGSYSYSSDSRSESRGRSSTRNSSYDRDRSGSRSSRGTNSPLGSISPTGSAVGIAYGQVGGRDRDGPRRVIRREGDRGRDRTGRRIGDSLSPPGMASSPSRSISDDFPAYSPIIEKTVLPSSAASVSGSSVSGSSTASVATENTAKPDADEHRGRSIAANATRGPSFPLPSPIPEEEETRSRQPTPANSPVRALSSPSATPPVAPPLHVPGSPLHVATPVKSRPSAPVTSPSEAQASPSSPVSPSAARAMRSPERQSRGDTPNSPQQTGTLVGRAAEIVAQARGFLGAIWNAV